MTSSSSSIVEVAKLVEADHAVIFLKTADGEIHGLEFGRHHNPKTAMATHHEDKPAAHHHDHAHQPHTAPVAHGHPIAHASAQPPAPEEHAAYVPGSYTVHLYSPFNTHPKTNFGVPKAGWMKAQPSFSLTPEGLNHHLKTEWYKEHVGCFVFHNETSFVDHVMAVVHGDEPVAAA